MTPRKDFIPACSVCLVPKTLDNTRKKTNGHWESRCRSCKNEATRNWRETPPARYLYAGCKSRAKSSGLPFNLEPADVVIPTHCPVLGIALSVTPHGRTANTPTVDRLVPSLGYVKGNIAVISWRANRLKNDATPDELRRLAEYAQHSNL